MFGDHVHIIESAFGIAYYAAELTRLAFSKKPSNQCWNPPPHH
jgi:hypothetical protein